MKRNVRLSADLKTVDQIKQKLDDQANLIKSLRQDASDAKRIDQILEAKLSEAKKRADWLDTCKEFGISPDITMNELKIN